MTLVFGMMRAAEREIAISADVIQEVVAWPARITPPLRSSDMIRGLFDLRGHAVPIVALSRLLGSDAPANIGGNVAVLSTPKGRIGLAVDSIGGILRVAAEQIHEFAGASSGAETTLMRGLLRTATEGTVPILDETALAALPGLLFLSAGAGARRDAAQRAMCTYLVFTYGEFRFGIDATCVREIIDAPEIEAAAVRSDLYRGIVRVRGGIAAVVELHTLLSLPDLASARTKLLVLEHDEAVVGLAVSDIVAIQRRNADDVLSVPEFGSARRDIVVGVMEAAAPEDPDVIVLSHAAILADREVATIRRLHAGITRASTQTGTRRAYLKVDAGPSLYVELSQCAEILPMPGRTLRVGPTDKTYLGLVRRGTRTWPLIRLRALLDDADNEMPASARVLVVRGGHAAFGFVVDAVQAIEYLAVRDDLGGTAATDVMRNAAMCAATRKIWVDSQDGPRMRMVLDLNALVEQLAATDSP